MVNYQKLYHQMFNAATDALRLMEQGEVGEAIRVLAAAQCSCEEQYLEEPTES